MILITIDGELAYINLQKVCMITDNYIQFDNGHIIYGQIDLGQVRRSFLQKEKV